MELLELLKGFDATKHNSGAEIEKLINANALELKAKVLVDDGKNDVYIPKQRLDEEIGKKKAIQDTLHKTNTELESIKKNAKGQDELVKQIEQLQNGNKELDGKLKAQTLETAIKLKAIELKSKDKSGADVLAFIDREKVKLNEDGTVTGLDEAMKTVTESKPYLFDADGQSGGTGTPGQGGKTKSNNEGFQGIGERLAKQQEANTPNMQQAHDLYF